jgi:uncharacterized OB-fold protein
MQKGVKMIAEGLFKLPDGHADKGYLIGAKCNRCGTVTFPKRVVCPNCVKEATMVETPLSKRGSLYSFSINQMAPEGFKAPYITGKIDLPEKVRIFSVITGCEPNEDALEIGMEMEIVFEPLTKDKDGRDLMGYKFRPIASRKGV